MAGFHFNNALFRLAAVYHRALKVALGVPAGGEMVDALRTRASARYATWSRQNLDKIHDQVNTIKHSSRGQFDRRKVKYTHAITATHELLDLIESWAALDGHTMPNIAFQPSAAGAIMTPPRLKPTR
jgi:hypothetical protein